MVERDWLIKEIMEIAKETVTKPPGRYGAEKVLSLYIQPNFSREQIENMQGSCELLGTDFNTFLEQHYTGRRRALFWPEVYFFLFSNSEFNHAVKTAIYSGVDRKELADYILYVFKDSIENKDHDDEHYIKIVEMIGKTSFNDYVQKIEEVKNYRKKVPSDKVGKMKEVLRQSAERIEKRLKHCGLEHLFDVRYYGSLYFGDPSSNPDIDGLIYFNEILSSTEKQVLENTLRIEERKMSNEMEKRPISSKASHYHAIELELLMKKLDQLRDDIKSLAPVREGNFIIDFSRAPAELLLSESIVSESSLNGFKKAQEKTLTSIRANPFLRALTYAHLEKIIKDRKKRTPNGIFKP